MSIELTTEEKAEINITFPGRMIRTCPPPETVGHPVYGRVEGTATFDSGLTAAIVLDDAYVYIFDPGLATFPLKTGKQMMLEYELKHRGGQDHPTLK